LRCRLIPSLACVLQETYIWYKFRPLRTTVPSELTKYVFTASNFRFDSAVSIRVWP